YKFDASSSNCLHSDSAGDATTPLLPSDSAGDATMPLLPSDSSEKEELVSAGELLNTSPLKACAEQSKEKGKSVARKSRATPDVATTSGATPDVATSSRKPTTSRKRKRSDVSV
ncbi:hypothetical protein OTU49_012536, partial [Cherax quadricarinatus]